MWLKNFLTKCKAFLSKPFTKKAATEDDADYLPDEEDEQLDEVVKHMEEAISQAKQSMLCEKIVKLKNGDVLLGRIVCDRRGVPITYNEQNFHIANPVVIKTIYLQGNGMLVNHNLFEEWVSNSSTALFPLEAAGVMCIAEPEPGIVMTYNRFLIKNRLYKNEPRIARHIYEMVMMDVPENYNQEMTEVPDEDEGGFDDGYPPSTEFQS